MNLLQRLTRRCGFRATKEGATELRRTWTFDKLDAVFADPRWSIAPLPDAIYSPHSWASPRHTGALLTFDSVLAYWVSWSINNKNDMTLSCYSDPGERDFLPALSRDEHAYAAKLAVELAQRLFNERQVARLTRANASLNRLVEESRDVRETR